MTISRRLLRRRFRWRLQVHRGECLVQVLENSLRSADRDYESPRLIQADFNRRANAVDEGERSDELELFEDSQNDVAGNAVDHRRIDEVLESA